MEVLPPFICDFTYIEGQPFEVKVLQRLSALLNKLEKSHG